MQGRGRGQGRGDGAWRGGRQTAERGELRQEGEAHSGRHWREESMEGESSHASPRRAADTQLTPSSSPRGFQRTKKLD